MLVKRFWKTDKLRAEINEQDPGLMDYDLLNGGNLAYLGDACELAIRKYLEKVLPNEQVTENKWWK